MRGLHLTADLYRCRCAPGALADAGWLEATALQALRAAGLAPLGVNLLARAGGAGGVSGAIVLAGGHLALHTDEATRCALLDLLLPQAEAALARPLVDALVARLAPEWTEQRSLERADGDTN